MADADDKAPDMKSAYELALERLGRAGIDPPDASALTDDERLEIAEIRREAEAKLAELEILHRDRLAGMRDPAEREQEEADHRLERRRVEEGRDRKIARLRESRGS